jgi:[ribosomal protein S5]-alanine N-acetyltransferase
VSDRRALARGDRVVLRRVDDDDEAEFLERSRASRSLHRPWRTPLDTSEGFRALVRRSRDLDVETMLVCRREDGAIAGVFDLSQIHRGAFDNAYLGYYAFVPHAGRGYMREGLDLTVRHAFGAMRLHRLQANIQPGNQRSIGLATAGGLRREGFAPRYLKIGGRWRDHEMWAITAEDVRARRSGAPPTPPR